MKKRFFCSALFFLSLGLLSCSQDKADEGKILARINDCNLTLDEFQYQLAAELEFDKDFKLTNEAKKEFLEELIRKELLVQEAKRLELDRKKKFVTAMERYWESTLIRDLMDLRGEEINGRTTVSQEEIAARYREMQKTEQWLPPLEGVQEKIVKKLKEEKRNRILKDWIIDLRKKADIEINRALLSKN